MTRGVSSESDVSDDLAAPEKEKEEEEEEEEEKEGEEKGEAVENEAEQEDVVSTPTEAVFEGAGRLCSSGCGLCFICGSATVAVAVL